MKTLLHNFVARSFNSDAGGVVVIAVITPPLPRDGDTARMAIQVNAVNLIEIG